MCICVCMVICVPACVHVGMFACICMYVYICRVCACMCACVFSVPVGFMWKCVLQCVCLYVHCVLVYVVMCVYPSLLMLHIDVPHIVCYILHFLFLLLFYSSYWTILLLPSAMSILFVGLFPCGFCLSLCCWHFLCFHSYWMCIPFTPGFYKDLCQSARAALQMSVDETAHSPFQDLTPLVPS